MPLYFAYGANLDRVAMAQRCPNSRPVGPAWLANHRFRIMQDGYATVVPDRAATVHGLMWDIAEEDFAALDAFEDVDSGLYRRSIGTIATASGVYGAAIYFATNTTIGAPCAGYMEAVLSAAEDCHLPAEYLAELRSWLPGANARSETPLRAPGPH